MAPWLVPGVVLSVEDVIHLLHTASEQHMLAPGVMLGEEFKYLTHLLYFAESLVIRQQYLPGVVESGNLYFARWQPVFIRDDQARLADFANRIPPVLYAIAQATESLEPNAHQNQLRKQEFDADTQALVPPQPSSIVAPTFIREIASTLVDWLVRRSTQSSDGSPMSASRTRAFHTQGTINSIDDCWLMALKSETGLLSSSFTQTELRRFADRIHTWQQPITAVQAAPFRLCFRLQEPATVETPQAANLAQPVGSEWNVTYLLQAVNDQSLQIPVTDVWSNNAHAKATFRAYKFGAREYLLSSLGQASMLCPQVAESLHTSHPHGFSLDSNGAVKFLSEQAILLEQSGFAVMLPSWWSRNGTKTRLSLSARVHSSSTLKAKGGLSLDKVVEFDWQAALGDVPLSLAELQAIAELKTSLINVRGQWVHFDANEVEAALKLLKRETSKATVGDVIKLSLGTGSPAGYPECMRLEAEGWIAELLEQLQEPDTVKELPPPSQFVGQLRPYQQRGFSWLAFLSSWGLGACLADDMGLGKTVQTLVLIQHQKMQGEKKPALLICPTSVVNNWCKEAARFTPYLPVLVHHGARRAKGRSFKDNLQDKSLVISSYSLLHRDIEHLDSIQWSGVILDEAQNIKNAETKQALAARQLKCDYRIALTGTPVENSVADLWAIMQFLNPGLLGTQNTFRKNFFYRIQLERDVNAMDKLKRVTQPFILRRLKTDQNIIADLPEKQEMKVYCPLSREQVTLYTAVLKDLESRLQSSQGIQRKGLILATLSKLKQVCNHPAHFQGDNSALPGRSGKLQRLGEMLEEVLAAGDKALIFSQFKEMGELITQYLEEQFGEQVLFLHGAITRSKRDEMVELFQSADGPQLFMLSLKAGGTGLNLTAANHVFHFDRWWNPAVENQASDRAYRIGQNKIVQVRKLLCSGTLEEKIDEMITTKLQLAQEVIGSGEGWLTELNNEELKRVFALSKEASVS